MRRKKIKAGVDIQGRDDLKKIILASAVATGNTYAYHDLFSWLKELSGASENDTVAGMLQHLAYLLPNEEMAGSPEYRAAMELVEQYEFKDDFVPATVLEETARRAVGLGKFAFAEDAYRLLGIKKEVVALYAQTGENLLREDKPRHATTAFYVAASLDRPLGPQYQYLGPQVHADCLRNPAKCPTTSSTEALVNTGIRFLLGHEPLTDRLMDAIHPKYKMEALATLAVIRDLDFPGLIKNVREAVEAVSGIEDGRPDDYSPVGPALLGRTCGADVWWQYLQEFSFEHPLGALCVCVKRVKNTPVLVPVIRDGKSIIESLLPPEYLNI